MTCTWLIWWSCQLHTSRSCTAWTTARQCPVRGLSSWTLTRLATLIWLMLRSSRFVLHFLLCNPSQSLSVNAQCEEGPHLLERSGWHSSLDTAAQHVASCAFTSLQASDIVNDNAHWLQLHPQGALLNVREGYLRHLAAPPASIRLADTQCNHQPSYQAALLPLLLLLFPVHFHFFFFSFSSSFSFFFSSFSLLFPSSSLWQA